MRLPIDPCGTARLGKSIEQGVVDSKLKVFGVNNLRVIDASIIPVIPDCRIQNSVYMIAEKVSGHADATYRQITNRFHREPTSSRLLTPDCMLKQPQNCARHRSGSDLKG